MSYALHTYFLNTQPRDENQVFESVQHLFAKSKRVTAGINKNPITNKNLLKLTVDGSYSISAFFDQGQNVTEDLESILGKKVECNSRLRFLFAPDPDNDFDDIGVIILDYLESFKDVIIYSANREKVIFPVES